MTALKFCKCTAKCWNSRTPKSSCDCVCGGLNHGVGGAMAKRNIEKHFTINLAGEFGYFGEV